MSNQGWSRLPRKHKSTGEKVFDVMTWPFRKVFFFVVARLMLRYGRRR